MFDVDALSFDGDGTLWDHDSAMHAGLRAAVDRFARRGVRTPEGAVTADWLGAIRKGIAHRASPHVSMEEIRLASFSEALRRCGGDDREATEVFDRFMEARLGALRLYDDVAEFLEAVSVRYPLVLVTNGNTWPAQLGWKARSGLW